MNHLQNKSTWELRAIVRALSSSVSSFLNTDQDNERLQQAQNILHERRKKNIKSINLEVK
jgi:SMC interacting uncharacterized protein involved in chromosome segregation